MKNTSRDKILSAVSAAYERALVWLPPDIAIVLECFSEAEPDPEARERLVGMCARFREAAEKNVPYRDDFDSALALVSMGPAHAADAEGILAAVRLALPVADAVILPVFTESDSLSVTVAPCKKAELRLFSLQTDSIREAEAAVKALVESSEPCAGAPIILGLGLGSSEDEAFTNACRALLRPMGERAENAEFAAVEQRLRVLPAGGFTPGVLGARIIGELCTHGKSTCTIVYCGYTTMRKTVVL